MKQPSVVDSAVEGNVTSRTRVVAYEDLQCPDSAAYRKMLDEQLLSRFGETVAFEYRAFPLAKHDWARDAAIAARYFAGVKPELGTAFRRYCYKHQKSITVDTFAAKVQEFAVANDSDAVRAEMALQAPSLAAQVDAEHQEGKERGVEKTPTVFVGAERFVEDFEFADISHAIELALKSAETK
jgi:protein-disulfide isomerase